MYNLDSLTTKLRQAGLQTHLETSGAYPLSGKWDWLCVSPKKFKAPISEILSMANELKVIVVNRHDFIWAEEHSKLVNQNCHRTVQPEWDKSVKILPMMIEYVKSNPQWRISLQEHKYLNIP